MYDLPQELLAAIIDSLQEQRWSRSDPKIRLAPLVCINRQWQVAIERVLCSHISIQTSADSTSNELHLFQQYVEGPSRRARRNLIKTLSLGWHHGAFKEYKPEKSDVVSESNTNAEEEGAASEGDDSWDFTIPIGCENEEGLEIDSGDEAEPDWDKINAMILDRDSDSEPEEYQSGHRSESDPDINGDTEADEAVPGNEEEEGDINVNANTSSYERATWERINVSDESNTEEPQEPKEVRKYLVELLQYVQSCLIRCIEDLWTYLESWESSLNIKRINIQLAGNAFNTKLYSGLRRDEERIVEFLKTTLVLEIDLPSLPQLEEVFVDWRRALVFWPLLIAAKLATASEPPVPIMEYQAQPFRKWWKAEAVVPIQSQGMYDCPWFVSCDLHTSSAIRL